jgi:hypothetical protein
MFLCECSSFEVATVSFKRCLGTIAELRLEPLVALGGDRGVQRREQGSATKERDSIEREFVQVEQSLHKLNIMIEILLGGIYNKPKPMSNCKRHHNPCPIKQRRLSHHIKETQYFTPEDAQHLHSMLIFINPSFAFSIPMRPTLFGPKVGVMLILPPLLERSPFDCPLMDGSLPVLVDVPHKLPSRCAGDCDMIGLL